MKGKLYLVPTPIGNLSDITLRAIDVLKTVDLILAEDTRVSKKLLQRYEIGTPMESYHEFNKVEKLPQILKQLKSHDVALISDAGTPGISDPGYELVQECIEHSFEIIPLPGPTAFVPALIASGMPTNIFTFLGFLPKKKSAQQELLQEFVKSRHTLILYESPYRLLETLDTLLETLGDRHVCIARELSKKFESFYRLDLSQVQQNLRDERIAGEIVIVVQGVDKADSIWNEDRVMKALTQETESGASLSQAAKNVAKVSGWKKSAVYELGLQK